MSVEVLSAPGMLEYFTPPTDGSKPWIQINAEPGTGRRGRNWDPIQIHVEIENIRGKEKQFTLDGAGFECHHAPSEMKAEDFDSDEVVQEKYYPECEEVYKRFTGASDVYIFDHTIRRNFPDRKDDTAQTRTPVIYVHVDQTPEATVARIHRHTPPTLAPAFLKKRYQIVNLWRPIRSVAYDRPLALCDFRTVDIKRDTMAQTLKYPDREGEIWAIKHDQGHSWKYWRGMTPEEIVLIKCSDSITDSSVALCTPHTSFADPTAPKDAKLRESIEIRALLFYDD